MGTCLLSVGFLLWFWLFLSSPEPGMLVLCQWHHSDLSTAWIHRARGEHVSLWGFEKNLLPTGCSCLHLRLAPAETHSNESLLRIIMSRDVSWLQSLGGHRKCQSCSELPPDTWRLSARLRVWQLFWGVCSQPLAWQPSWSQLQSQAINVPLLRFSWKW